MSEVWGTIGPRGAEQFEDDGRVWTWARCHKDGCEHFVCRRLSDLFCWKHTDGQPGLAELINETNNEPVNV